MNLLGLPDVDVAAWDVEASGLFPDDGARVACIAVAWYEDDTINSAAFPFDQGIRDKYNNSQLDLFESGDSDPNLGQTEWEALIEWLLGRKMLVAHNALYDMTMTAAGTRHFKGKSLHHLPVFDTMLSARELDPLQSASLDATSRRAGGEGKKGLEAILDWNKANQTRLRKMGCDKPLKRYDLAPWSVAAPYVTVDAELTIQAFRNHVRRMATDADVTRRIKAQFKFMRLLTKLEERGIGYDTTASLVEAGKLTRQAAELEATLPFKPTRAGAVAYFCGTKGLMTDRVSAKTGAPSLDAEQISAWTVQGVEHAREYGLAAKMRRTESMHYSGYAEKMGPDSRLRTRFKQATVRSGRLACERVNLQAIPKQDKTVEGIRHIKDLILPRPGGYGLWNLDLSQAELRVAAQYSQCVNMLAELQSDDPDIHGKTTAGVMKIPRDHPDWDLKRDIGKRLTFSSIFVCGAPTMQATLSREADIHLPLEEVQAMLKDWHNLYPEYRATKQRAEKSAATHGYVRILPNTPYEGKSWFGPTDEPHTAWSRRVQGSLALAFSMLLVGVEERWPGKMILTVHDSILLECLEDEGDEICAAVCEYAAELMTPLFGITMGMDGKRFK